MTREGETFSGPVEQVVLPGSEGEFGVLEKHGRFLTSLRQRVMEIRSAQGSYWSFVADGFAEVDAEHVVVMAGAYHGSKEIDRWRRRTETPRSRAGGRPARANG